MFVRTITKSDLPNESSFENASIEERIAFELLHGGDFSDWRKRLPKRPDWQNAIKRVKEIIEESHK